jgi:hypothetical protein
LLTKWLSSAGGLPYSILLELVLRRPRSSILSQRPEPEFKGKRDEK